MRQIFWKISPLLLPAPSLPAKNSNNGLSLPEVLAAHTLLVPTLEKTG